MHLALLLVLVGVLLASSVKLSTLLALPETDNTQKER